jgi:hypothetical protein
MTETVRQGDSHTSETPGRDVGHVRGSVGCNVAVPGRREVEVGVSAKVAAVAGVWAVVVGVVVVEEMVRADSEWI